MPITKTVDRRSGNIPFLIGIKSKSHLEQSKMKNHSYVLTYKVLGFNFFVRLSKETMWKAFTEIIKHIHNFSMPFICSWSVNIDSLTMYLNESMFKHFFKCIPNDTIPILIAAISLLACLWSEFFFKKGTDLPQKQNFKRTNTAQSSSCF